MMTGIDRDTLVRRVRDELLGRYFSNRSELRHMAEKAGFSFVPVEFLARRDQDALVSLKPQGAGEIRVRATRPVPWQPYCITDVAAA